MWKGLCSQEAAILYPEETLGDILEVFSVVGGGEKVQRFNCLLSLPTRVLEEASSKVYANRREEYCIC